MAMWMNGRKENRGLTAYYGGLNEARDWGPL